MGLWLLTNTAGHEAADMPLLLSGTFTEQAGGELTQNVRGGPRSLTFDLNGLAAPVVTFVNTNNGFTTPTHFVGANFANLAGEAVAIYEWHNGNYPGVTVSQLFGSASFAETLIGIDGTDWCRPISATANCDAFGVRIGISPTAKLNKCYFSAGQEFDFRAGSLEFAKVPAAASSVFFKNHYWKLHGQARFGVTRVTASQLDTYHALPKNDAVFFYDDTGSSTVGNFLPHKLWHCLILEESITQLFDDLYQIDFTVGVLKHGNG